MLILDVLLNTDTVLRADVVCREDVTDRVFTAFCTVVGCASVDRICEAVADEVIKISLIISTALSVS